MYAAPGVSTSYKNLAVAKASKRIKKGSSGPRQWLPTYQIVSLSSPEVLTRPQGRKRFKIHFVYVDTRTGNKHNATV